MEINLLYRIFLDNDGKTDRIELLECLRTEQEASKYARLLDMQTPSDIKNKIKHKYFYLES